MTSDEDLVALWGASAPAAEEEAELQRLARHTPRRARMVQWGELAAAALIGGLVLAVVVWNLGPAPMLVGALILLLLGWSAWKRHRLRTIALLIDERDRITFIRSTLRAKQAELDRSALGLAFAVPGIFLTMLLGYSLRGPGEGDLGAFLVAILTTSRGLVVIGILTCTMLLLAFSHARLLGELKRLRDLHEAYEAEERLDQFLGR